jgi:hypothetical protein
MAHITKPTNTEMFLESHSAFLLEVCNYFRTCDIRLSFSLLYYFFPSLWLKLCTSFRMQDSHFRSLVSGYKPHEAGGVYQYIGNIKITKNPQRQNSGTAFLVEVSGHKLESSQARVFAWFSIPFFSFYKMLIKTQVFLFRGFFLYRFLKQE